jgi:hypothetical protein
MILTTISFNLAKDLNIGDITMTFAIVFFNLIGDLNIIQLQTINPIATFVFFHVPSFDVNFMVTCTWHLEGVFYTSPRFSY